MHESDQASSVQVVLSDNGDKKPVSRTLIWRVFGTMRDDEWHYAHVNVSAGRHRLLFEVNGDNYQAAIKDVEVKPGHCPKFSESKILQKKLYRYVVCSGVACGLIRCLFRCCLWIDPLFWGFYQFTTRPTMHQRNLDLLQVGRAS